MRPAKPYMLGVWVLAIVTIFRILLLGFYYYIFSRFAIRGTTFGAIPFLVYLFIIIPAIETYIYWLIRYRITNRAWVHLHVWSVFIGFVLLPLFLFFVMPALYRAANPGYYPQMFRIQVYFFWGLFIIGHVFFIATIVRYFKKKKEPDADDTTAGLLDEFLS